MGIRIMNLFISKAFFLIRDYFLELFLSLPLNEAYSQYILFIIMNLCRIQKDQLDHNTYCCLTPSQRAQLSRNNQSTNPTDRVHLSKQTNHPQFPTFKQQHQNKSCIRQKVSLSKIAAKNRSTETANKYEINSNKNQFISSFNDTTVTPFAPNISRWDSKGKKMEETLVQKSIQRLNKGFKPIQFTYTPQHFCKPIYPQQQLQNSLKNNNMSDQKIIYPKAVRSVNHYPREHDVIKQYIPQSKKTQTMMKQQQISRASEKDQNELKDFDNQSKQEKYSNSLKQSLRTINGQIKRQNEFNNPFQNPQMVSNSNKIPMQTASRPQNKKIQMKSDQSSKRIQESIIIMDFFNPEGELKEKIYKDLKIREQSHKK